MVKTIGMYFLMGLILNTIWAVGFTIYVGVRINWDTKMMNDVMDVFMQFPWTSFVEKLMKTKEGKKQIALTLLIGYSLWPINIATGLTRIPDVNAYINANVVKKEKL